MDIIICLINSYEFDLVEVIFFYRFCNKLIVKYRMFVVCVYVYDVR